MDMEGRGRSEVRRERGRREKRKWEGKERVDKKMRCRTTLTDFNIT